MINNDTKFIAVASAIIAASLVIAFFGSWSG